MWEKSILNHALFIFIQSRGDLRAGFLVFQSAKVHFGVHLKMEKSLPNPIALALSYNIRSMECAGRAGKKEKNTRDTNPDWVEAAADEQIKHSIFMTEIKTR